MNPYFAIYLLGGLMIGFGWLMIFGNVLTEYSKRDVPIMVIILGIWCLMPIFIPTLITTQEMVWVYGMSILALIYIGIMLFHWNEGAVTPVPNPS